MEKHNLGKSNEVVIVGGGVIGCSIAFHLARLGASVTLLERDLIGSHASRVGGGLLLRYLEGEEDDSYRVLVSSSHEMFPKLAQEIRELTAYDIEYLQCGVLTATDDPTELDQYRMFATQYARMPDAPRMIDTAELRELWPFAHTRYIGGVLVPNEGQVNSPRFVRGLALAAERSGARVCEGRQVTGIKMEGNRVLGVTTDQGDLAADLVILAAGPWTGLAGKWVGRRIPIRPVRGQVVHLHTNKQAMSVIVHTADAYLHQRADGTILVGATVEEAGFDCRLTSEGVASQLRAGLAAMPALSEWSFKGAQVALRPETDRTMPYVGKLEGIDNLIVASGHFRNGIMLAPITGKLVADMVTGRPIDPRLAGLSPDSV